MMNNHSTPPSHVWRNILPFAPQLSLSLCLLVAIVVGITAIPKAVASADGFTDANWCAMGNTLAGTDGTVVAFAVDDSENLYIGGFFQVAGNVAANSIAKWDGTNWSALGSGIQGEVHALCASGNDLYVAGTFTSAGGVSANKIAKWDGVRWSALGSGIGSYDGIQSGVYALSMSGGNLYAGGFFPMAGGLPATNIAKWDGRSWSALGSGMGGPPPFYVSIGVYSLAASGNNVYAAGDFTRADETMAIRVARWDGTNWFALGSGIEGGTGYVNALAVAGADLYVGGDFTIAGGRPATNIARWDGTQWNAMDSTGVGPVTALAASGSVLYAAAQAGQGGVLTEIAKWDGSRWSALTGELHGNVHAMAVTRSNLVVGGRFMMAGQTAVSHIAKWTGTSWSALSPGNTLNGMVNALALLNGEVYAGGAFQSVGGSSGDYIAKWTGSDWTTVGSGIDGPDPGEPVFFPGSVSRGVFCLAVSGTNLYAGGRFDTAGGAAAFGVARWNGNGWSALGGGISGSVYAMTTSGSDLFVAGSFLSASDVAANSIAKWDGTNWSALGSGMFTSQPRSGFSVRALVKFGNHLYAGGEFTLAGHQAPCYLARWDETNWSPVSSQISSAVSALAVSGGNLYAGGSSVMKWDGTVWTELPWGSGSFVSELAVSGNDVYAGGYLATAGTAVFHVAKWSGSNWSALGSGMNNGVVALLASGNDLYAGGAFTTAGGKLASYVARAYLPALPGLSVLRSRSDVLLSWPSANGADFILEEAGLSSGFNWTTSSATIADNGSVRSVTLPTASAAQLFRLRRP